MSDRSLEAIQFEGPARSPRRKVIPDQQALDFSSLRDLSPPHVEARRPISKRVIKSRNRFVYLRPYGPQDPVFDGSWKPGDFEMVK